MNREEKVYRSSLLVHGPTQVAPLPAALDVGPVQPPAIPNRQLAEVEFPDQLGREGFPPPIRAQMLRARSPFCQHFLQVSIAQRVFGIPANTQQNESFWVSITYEVHCPTATTRAPTLPWTRQNQRSKAETAFSRYKAIIGQTTRARKLSVERFEVRVDCRILNVMTDLGVPDAVKLKSTITAWLGS